MNANDLQRGTTYYYAPYDRVDRLVFQCAGTERKDGTPPYYLFTYTDQFKSTVISLFDTRHLYNDYDDALRAAANHCEKKGAGLRNLIGL